MIPNRRPCWTEDFDDFAVTVGYMPDKRAHDLCGRAVEVFITKRAKSGSELEDSQFDLGVVASKLMQHRHRDG